MATLLAIEEIRIEDYFGAMDYIVHHYYAVGGHKVAGLQPPIDIAWDKLQRLEEEGHTLTVGAIDDVSLIGFVLYLIINHLHHQTVKIALCDILAVSPNHRGRGIGRALMKHAEPLLCNEGVKQVAHGFRTCYDEEPLFPKLGYRLIEQTYAKEL